jgi:hypothetical protein
MHAESIRDLTGGLPLPSGFHEALAKFTGTEEGEEGDEGTKSGA